VAQSIQGYLHGLPNEHKRIAAALMKLIQQAAPKASVAMKWDQIAFEQNGPFCFIKSTPSHVVFGFWRGQELDAAKGKLEADNKAMAHLKLTAEGDIKKDLFQRWVKEAVKLNLFRPLAP
jgi:hypothetical protein